MRYLLLFLITFNCFAQLNNTTRTGKYDIITGDDILYVSPTGSVTVPYSDFFISSGKIGLGTSTPTPSALFEISSGTQGAIHSPLMTEASRDGIASPAEGLFIWNTDTSTLNAFDGSAWGAVAGSGGGGSSGLSGTPVGVYYANTSTTGIADPSLMSFNTSTGEFSVTGGYNDSSLVNGRILVSTGNKITEATATGNDQFLAGPNLVPVTISAGDNITILTDSSGFIISSPTTVGAFASIGSTTSFTPTLSAAFGTPAPNLLFGKYRRVGDRMIGTISFQSGAVSGTTATFDVPEGLTLNLSKIIANGTMNRLGIYQRTSASESHASGGFQGLIFTDQSDDNSLFWSSKATSALSVTKETGTSMLLGSDSMLVNFDFPILEWDANFIGYKVGSSTVSWSRSGTAIDCTIATATGLYNTFSYGANTNGATICGAGSPPTTEPSNDDGARIFTRAYDAASTCALPARFDVCIDTDVANLEINLYRNTGQTDAMSVPYGVSSALTIAEGMRHAYSKTTGVLTLDAGHVSTAVTAHEFLDTINNVSATGGYCTFDGLRWE